MLSGEDYREQRDRRQQILDSAFVIFSQKGYHNTKVDEVAQHAGIGKGTVYLYFPSKEHLLREMLKAMVDKYLTHVKTQMMKQGDPLAKLIAMYSAHFSLLQECPSLAQLYIHDFAFVNDELQTWLVQQRESFIEHIAQIVSEGIEQNIFRPLNTHLAASLLAAGLSVFGPEQKASAEMVDELLDMLQHGLCS